MKEYTISYIGVEDGQKINMVASGCGNNETEAIQDFMNYHNDCVKIIEVEFYKNCGRVFEA